MKTATKTALKVELKYSPMWEGSTCIAEPNLEVQNKNRNENNYKNSIKDWAQIFSNVRG